MSAVTLDNIKVSYQRKSPILTKDAYPSIFPNQPSYHTREPPTKRKTPDERRSDIAANEEIKLDNILKKDIINSISEITDIVSEKMKDRNWFSSNSDNCINTVSYTHLGF